MGGAVRREVLGDAVRGEVVAYSGAVVADYQFLPPLPGPRGRARAHRTSEREEGEAAKCILHVGEAHSVISSTWL